MATLGRVLTHGQFFGRFEQRREVAGFSLAHLSADPIAEVQSHTHEDAHFILLLDGLYLSSAREAPPVCVGPTLIYNPPGTTHRDRFDRQEGRFDGRFFGLSVSSARMRNATELVRLLEVPIYVSRRETMTLIRRLARDNLRWERASPLVVEGLCMELLAEVAQRRAGESLRLPGWLRVARELLHDRCTDDISIAEIAREAGVHPIHLARTFRRFLHCTPGEYLRRCRVHRAAGLLRETRRPLSHIALDSGFADQSHMTHAFQRHFGLPPGRFRRVSG
jgi:AraC family transcriptional regulator